MKFFLIKNAVNTLTIKTVIAAGGAGGALPPELTNAINNLLNAIKLLGGAVSGIMIAICAFHFIKGGREDFQIGKGKVAGIIIGLVMVAAAAAIQTWINGMVGF